jgi:hypothetical protein
MKKQLLLTLTLAVAPLLFMGCATSGGPVLTQQTLNDAAIVLEGAARGAAVLAIAKDAKNREYVQLAVAALDTFLVGDSYVPGDLVKALSPVVAKVNDPAVFLAVNTATDFYQAFYGRYVKGKVSENANAKMFLTALRDGAASALSAKIGANDAEKAERYIAQVRAEMAMK